MSDEEIKQVLLGFIGANENAFEAYLHLVEKIEEREVTFEEVDDRVSEIREWLDAR